MSMSVCVNLSVSVSSRIFGISQTMNGICNSKGKALHYYLPFFLNLLRLYYYNLSLKPPHSALDCPPS